MTQSVESNDELLYGDDDNRHKLRFSLYYIAKSHYMYLHHAVFSVQKSIYDAYHTVHWNTVGFFHFCNKTKAIKSKGCTKFRL